MVWLAELKRNDFPEGHLLAAESEILYSMDDPARAERLATDSLRLNDQPIFRQYVSSQTARALAWTPSYSYERDSQSRRSWLFDQTLDIGHTGPLKWALREQHGEYLQNSVPTVVDNSAGLKLDFPFALYHRFTAEALAHFLSGTPRNSYSALGTIQSSWTDSFSSRVQAGRSLYDTALALENNITSTYGDIAGFWHQKDDTWKANAEGRAASLSDNNRRLTGWLEASRAVPDVEVVRVVARVTYDDMKTPSPNYYSPNQLRLYGLGPELFFTSKGHVELDVHYLPSFVQERGQKTGIYQNADARLSARLLPELTVTPSYAYLSTPSYYESRFMMELEYRF